MPYFLSLVDTRRIVPTHAVRRCQQLVDPIFAFLQIKLNITTVNIKPKTNASSIPRQPLDRPPGRPALYNSLEIITQQSAARGTSSRKQHQAISQLRTNTTALFPVYRGERPNQQRRQRHHSNNKARLPRRLYFSTEYSRGKQPTNDAIPGRMRATGFFRGYCLLLTIRPSRGAV